MTGALRGAVDVILGGSQRVRGVGRDHRESAPVRRSPLDAVRRPRRVGDGRAAAARIGEDRDAVGLERSSLAGQIALTVEIVQVVTADGELAHGAAFQTDKRVARGAQAAGIQRRAHVDLADRRQARAEVFLDPEDDARRIVGHAHLARLPGAAGATADVDVVQADFQLATDGHARLRERDAGHRKSAGDCDRNKLLVHAEVSQLC